MVWVLVLTKECQISTGILALVLYFVSELAGSILVKYFFLKKFPWTQTTLSFANLIGLLGAITLTFGSNPLPTKQKTRNFPFILAFFFLGLW